MTDDKPREFWLYKDDIADNYCVYQEKSNMSWCYSVHVIEMSAFTQLQKENEDLRLSMTTGDRNWNGMNREIDSLRECLSLAAGQMKEAINGLHRGYVIEAENDLRLILNQIKAKYPDVAK
jgi:hypothetical protein